jgi:hypothetical protein
MSARLDCLFSLSQSTPATSDVWEQAQTAVRQAVERLLATMKCAPDDEEGQEDEQNHWMKEWNNRMVSTRFAFRIHLLTETTNTH